MSAYGEKLLPAVSVLRKKPPPSIDGETIEYEVEGNQERYETDVPENCYDMDFSYIAIGAAVDFFHYQGGYQTSWPKEIEIFLNRESVGVFLVDLEMCPVFSAKKVEEA